MLSNIEIKKRLIGGYGTAEGAKKNIYIKYQKKYKGVAKKPTYEEFKKPVKKSAKPAKKNLTMITDNINIKAKNIVIQSNNKNSPTPTMPAPPPPPISHKKLKSGNELNLRDSEGFSKKLSERQLPALDFLSDLKSKISNPQLKKASDRQQKIEPEKIDLMTQLRAALEKRNQDLKGGYFYDDSKNYSKITVDYSNNYKILMNKRNKYGFAK